MNLLGFSSGFNKNLIGFSSKFNRKISGFSSRFIGIYCVSVKILKEFITKYETNYNRNVPKYSNRRFSK